MSEHVVYLDKVFIGNLAVNYLILRTSGRLAGVRGNRIRLLVAAGLGSLYAVLMFLPGTGRYFYFFIKIAVSLLMVGVAFLPLPVRRYLSCLGFFYLGSFLLGGAVMGFSYLIYRGGYYQGVKNVLEVVDRYLWPGLILAALVLLGASVAVPRQLRGRLKKDALKMPVTIILWGKKVVVEGLVDTGNSLTDPVSGVPVMVVEYGALKNILPDPLKAAMEKYRDGMTVVSVMAGTRWNERLRLIPFKSLGNDRGLLLGIRPDCLEIKSGSEIKRVEKTVLAIHNSRLDPGRQYSALLHPDLVENVPAA
ncbi:sporulation sigma-E factor processing peptidase [Desulfocucumis palustris]|uniref:Sporulation sigma-E factor-processing peptidase n=1 Tax=Desulfocucumis palustris TaxID=1898651 RepID=A0A2L2XKJ8_9FIRM|nr:sigma-E processing peptidase SpoIIGA [Desulfocucumis palustris]GBF34441.1 sporulation sigma-E factor processing peptidase [Desulfocucumis palustris]